MRFLSLLATLLGRGRRLFASLFSGSLWFGRAALRSAAMAVALPFHAIGAGLRSSNGDTADNNVARHANDAVGDLEQRLLDAAADKKAAREASAEKARNEAKRTLRPRDMPHVTALRIARQILDGRNPAIHGLDPEIQSRAISLPEQIAWACTLTAGECRMLVTMPAELVAAHMSGQKLSPHLPAMDNNRAEKAAAEIRRGIAKARRLFDEEEDTLPEPAPAM